MRMVPPSQSLSLPIPVQRAAAEGTLNQRLYKRLVMALFAWAALSAGISLVYRDLWYYRPLM